MEALTIKWTKIALKQNINIAEWYRINLGQKAASHYMHDVERTILLLAKFPRMGQPEVYKISSKRDYYSFLIHPKYRVIYYFTETTLCIQAFRCTLKRR